ncbi:hypothetical protein ACH4FE_35710 [Streptomyces celluloflavus]|uniref:hypothetical protein n=1 Tax=Streptomyces celluloflavus TaxID=58344 RepID=UPI0037B794A2
MHTEHYLPVGQEVGPRTPAPPTTLWQPAAQRLPAPQPTTPALTLYQVPVPGAVQVHLPDGRIAWGRPVEHHLDPAPQATASEPMPAWTKSVAVVAASLTALALGGAAALRIAAPALGGLVDVLDAIWKVALTLAVILLGSALAARRLFHHTTTSTTDGTDSEQTVVFAPQIDTGGTRLLGRSGDVNIQWGDRNRNKQ